MQEDDDYKKSKIKIGTWKKIFKVVAHSRSHIIKLLIFSILLAGVDSLTPLLNRFAIEHFLNDNPDFSYISTYIILYSILIVFFGIIVFSFIKEAGTIEALTSYHLRKQAFDNLQRLPFSYYDKNSHGWLMARMTSDSRKLSNILSWGLLDIIWTLFSIIIILIILFITYWKLALVFLVVIPIMGVVSFAINKRILKHNRAARSLNSQVTAGWNESFSGAKTTKTLNIENKNLLEFGEVVFNLKKSSIRAATVSNFFVSIMLFISYATVCFLLVAGGVLVVTPDSLFKIGTLYMFIQYTQAICDPMMQLSRVAANLQSAQASAERIVGLIETKPTLEDSKEVIEKYGDLFSPKQENYEEINGDIEVRDVSFSYKEGENILEHFNLKIKAGQSIALVGHTGSGKSTLVNLISRFY
ncbi:MAG: ATP-binding cassette domain-containing protein, partial [Acholeplasmatales bacterium]|nr:ATP-binding cassette domain-containing protein [Acholeplasmatales bacterium]